MSAFATIPKTAPFSAEDVEMLNRVVGPASPIQRAWLAGFLAGVESVGGVPQTAEAPRPAEPLTVVFASESGNCEKLAGDMAKQARKLGFKPNLIDMADMEVAELARANLEGFINSAVKFQQLGFKLATATFEPMNKRFAEAVGKYGKPFTV